MYISTKEDLQNKIKFEFVEILNYFNNKENKFKSRDKSIFLFNVLKKNG